VAGSAASLPPARGLSIFQKLLLLTLSLIAATVTVPALYLPARLLQRMQAALEAKALAYAALAAKQAKSAVALHARGAALGNAIGAFERGLITPSRWDDYLRGNESASLHSLTGKLLEAYIAQPQLPARAGRKDRS